MHCDHVDLQLYRLGCSETVSAAYRLRIAGRRDSVIAVYNDGSHRENHRLYCLINHFTEIGNRLFIFRWKNLEQWLTPITRG